MKVSALIVAGGSSRRFGGEVPKQFIEVCGRPLLSWTIDRFQQSALIDNIVIVAADEYLLYVSEKVIDPFGFSKVSKIVVGGEERVESVMKGLDALPVSTDFVAIHDGARPLVAIDDIKRTVETAMTERAAILAVPASDTVKYVKDGFILSTKDRDTLFLAQTPQVFQYDLIKEAYKSLGADRLNGVTDDASVVERAGFKVKIVTATGPNIKVTQADDLQFVKTFLKEEKND